MEGLVPIAEPMRPDAEVSPSWYVRDRLRNYSGRCVVVMVDLRVHWSLTGPVFLTRRKTLAVRDEIQMGAWKAACMFDDYTIVYHRAWDYGDFTSDRGSHKRTREGAKQNVTSTFCLRCAEITPSGMHLCAGSKAGRSPGWCSSRRARWTCTACRSEPAPSRESRSP